MDYGRDVPQGGSHANFQDQPIYAPTAQTPQNGIDIPAAYNTPYKKPVQVSNAIVTCDPTLPSTVVSGALPSGSAKGTMQLKRIDSTINPAEFGILIIESVELAIQIGDIDYKVFGNRLITMSEAESMYEKLLAEVNKG